MAIRNSLGWLTRQVSGFYSGVRSYVGTVTFSDVLPPSLVGFLAFVLDAFPKSLGASDTPGQQLSAVLTASVAMIVASLGILTPIGILYAVVYGGIALLRFIPAVDRRWPFSTDSWPFWEVS